MQSKEIDNPIAQIISTRGRLELISEAFRPKAVRVAKNTTNASKLSAIEANALFEDLFRNVFLVLHLKSFQDCTY